MAIGIHRGFFCPKERFFFGKNPAIVVYSCFENRVFYGFILGKNINLSSDINEFLRSEGADLVGFADLKPIPLPERMDFLFAVSIGVALDPFSLDGVERGPTHRYFSEYEQVNRILDSLSAKTAAFINRKGYRSLAHSATTERFDLQSLATDLPHKTVATLGGLGWIGKCALLVTEQYGSAIRLTKVLTDAQLEPSTPIIDSKCDDCTDCIDACPCNAPIGVNWKRGIERESIYNAKSCRKTARKLAWSKLGIEASFCGICIAACPWSRRYIDRAAKQKV